MGTHEAVELWGDRGPMPWAAGTRTQFIRIRTSRLTGRRVLPRYQTCRR